MLVCLCYPTSEAEIAEHIETGARSVEEIGMRCGAGTECGACHCQIEEILDDLAPASCQLGLPGVAAKPAGADCSRRPISIRSRPTSSREAA